MFGISRIISACHIPKRNRSQTMSPFSVLPRAMSTFDLQDHLPVYSPAKAVPILALSLLTSWYICYLVHLPVDTRFLRRALWPVSVGAFLWGIITIDMRGRECRCPLTCDVVHQLKG